MRRFWLYMLMTMMVGSLLACRHSACAYDLAGRLEQRTDPRGQVTTYTNNWRGQPLTKTVKVSETALAELEESFTYYPTGWAKAAWMDTATEAGASNKTTFIRDAFGQATAVTQTVDGVSKAVGSLYYPCGDRKQLAYPADVAVTLAFTQDGLGQTTEIKRNGSVLATYGYGGRKVLWRDIVAAGGSGTHVRWEVGLDIHRQQARLSNKTVVGTTTTILDQTDYTYDLAGNRKTAVVNAGDKRLNQTAGDGYGYDSLDRLVSAVYPAGQSESFHYDRLGNRSTFTDRQGRPNTYGPANVVNQYTSINGVPLATGDPETTKYDAAGNLLANEHGYGFGYDYENRLVKVYTDSNHNAQWDAGEPVLADYTYDALGHRIKQVKDSQTTRYYYDGETVLAEYDASSGNLLRYHIHGPTYIDEHILLHEQAHGPQPEAEYYYLLGPLYSVTGLVNANGAVVERYRYDAYGLPTRFGFGNFTGDDKVDLRDFLVFQKAFSGNQPCTEAGRQCDANGDGRVDLADYQAFAATVTGTGPQAPRISPFLFTGQPLDFLLTDPATGKPTLVLYHYRGRGYLAYDGRFLQMDPALYQDSMNLYEYVKSQPTMGVDPTGRFFDLIDFSASAALSLSLEANNLDIGRGLVGAIRGFGDMVSARNQLLTNLTGLALSTPDMSGIDAVLAAYSVYEYGQMALLGGGVLKAGMVFAEVGVTAIWKLGAPKITQLHHVLPKYLGGNGNGWLYRLDKGLHKEFHSGLIARLEAAGIERGDYKTWKEYFEDPDNHGLRGKAWDVLLDFTEEFDANYGTNMFWALIEQMADRKRAVNPVLN